MTLDLPAGQQSRRSTILGWMLFISFAVLFWNIVNMPRTALDAREPLRHFHYSLSLIVSLLAALRLYWWFREPAPKPPEGLPEASFGFNRAILMALLLVFVAETVIGFPFTWAAGFDLVLFGIRLPPLMHESEPLRIGLHYLHSALGFYYMMLFSIWISSLPHNTVS